MIVASMNSIERGVCMITAVDLISEMEKSIYFVPHYKYRRIRVVMYMIARNMILGDM